MDEDTSDQIAAAHEDVVKELKDRKRAAIKSLVRERFRLTKQMQAINTAISGASNRPWSDYADSTPQNVEKDHCVTTTSFLTYHIQ